MFLLNNVWFSWDSLWFWKFCCGLEFFLVLSNGFGWFCRGQVQLNTCCRELGKLTRQKFSISKFLPILCLEVVLINRISGYVILCEFSLWICLCFALKLYALLVKLCCFLDCMTALSSTNRTKLSSMDVFNSFTYQCPTCVRHWHSWQSFGTLKCMQSMRRNWVLLLIVVECLCHEQFVIFVIQIWLSPRAKT